MIAKVTPLTLRGWLSMLLSLQDQQEDRRVDADDHAKHANIDANIGVDRGLDHARGPGDLPVEEGHDGCAQQCVPQGPRHNHGQAHSAANEEAQGQGTACNAEQTFSRR